MPKFVMTNSLGKWLASLGLPVSLAMWICAASIAANAQTSSLPAGYTPSWVATPAPAQTAARQSLLRAQQEVLKSYPDTSLTSCPAGWRLKYFFYYQDRPEFQGSSWCGAAQADLDWANANDPNRWRIPYLLDACTPGVSWFYSHQFRDGTRYHSPAYRDITMVCVQAELKIAASIPVPSLPLDARGQPQQVVVTVTQDGVPAPDVSVSLQLSAAGAGGSAFIYYSTTNGAGQVVINYTPPQSLLGANQTDRYVVDCNGCTNSANISFEVQGSPLTDSSQTCDAGQSTPHPVRLPTGTKVKAQTDWLDSGPHSLTFTRNYASRWTVPPGAAMGNEWSHNFAGRVAGAAAPARTRTVMFADGPVSTFVNLAPSASIDPNSGGTWSCEPQTACVPPPVFDPNPVAPKWTGQGNLDTMADAPEGIVVRRASDDSVWVFDAVTGSLLRWQQRNGWVYGFSYTNGALARVTNAFGRSLAIVYDVSGHLSSVATPDGQTFLYGYDNAGRLSATTVAGGTSKTYLYEDTRWPGALTGIIDELGNRFETYTYDGQGRPVSTEFAGGVGRYDLYSSTSGASVTDPLGQTRYYQYIALSGQKVRGFRTESASDPDIGYEPVSRRSFTDDGLLESERDYLGVNTLFQWDTSRGLMTSKTRAAGLPEAQAKATQWHPILRLPALVTEAGRSAAYAYDAHGNTVSMTVTETATAKSRAWLWTYTAQGLVDTMTDPKGGIWRYGYDAAGNRTSVSNPLGQQTRYAFDAGGRVTSQTQANGLVTTYAYDARGRLATQARGGEATTYAYTATGQVASVTMVNGYQLAYTYDTAQRLIAAADNRGALVQYTLDAMGNRIREEVRDAGGAIAKVTGRLIDNLNHVAALQGAIGQTTVFRYDQNGEPASTTDPLNQTTSRRLDGLRRPVATTLADNASATQAWNQLDQLTQVTDPKGVATGYQTNAFGELTAETSPDIGSVSYQRNAAGEVIGSTDAVGNQTSLERDALGRPTSIQYAPDQLEAFSYDQGQVGYLSKIDDKAGTTSYMRDAQGRILSKTQSVNDNPANPSRFKVQYGYANGELISLTYPSGLKVFYNRTAGRITGIDVQQPSANPLKPRPVVPFVTGLAHMALGQPKAWSWAGGDSATRSFDTDGRMTASEFASYQYDAASRITGITQRLWASRTVAQGTRTVTELYTTPLSWSAGYDSRNRLTSLVRSGAETRYTYDANSNRLSAIDQVTSDTDLDGLFDADDFSQTTSQSLSLDAASNKLLGFTQTVTKVKGTRTQSITSSQVNYALDANGAMTSDGLRSFEYDASGRLSKVKIVRNGEAAKLSYLHNALGQRVFKSEVTAEQTLPNQSTLGLSFIDWLKKNFQWMFTQAQASTSIGTGFVYDEDGNLLGEYDNGSSAGKGRQEYIWLPTDDGQAVPIGIYKGTRLYAVHADHLGTPRLITDEDNKPVWQWPYSAFGNNKPSGVLKATRNPKAAITNQPVLLKATAADIEANLRFPGQYFDEESNLSYNYFRSYNGSQGRYTQADPIGLAGGSNRFAYVGGNPLRFVDPLGLWRDPSDIYDDAMRDARRSGLPGAHNGLQDGYRHCVASCEMARENTAPVAQCLGWLNEKRGDWMHNQQSGERQMDDFNNAAGVNFGRKATSTQACQAACMGAATSGALKTYRSGTTPGYLY